MIVASTESHQEKLETMLIKENVSSKDIFLLNRNNNLFLTFDNLKAKKVPAYKVVITTVRHSAGYSLTYLNTFISGIYPSNQATRDQLEGRINRIDQRCKEIQYLYVSCGILPYIRKHHSEAKSLSVAISDIAKNVG